VLPRRGVYVRVYNKQGDIIGSLQRPSTTRLSMEEHFRNALDDCTNTKIPETPAHRHKGKRLSSWLPTPPTSGPRGNKVAKRRAGGDNTSSSKKRVKLGNGGDDNPFLDDATSESSVDWDSDGSDETSVKASKAQRITGGVDAPLLCARVNAWMNPLGTFNRLSGTFTFLNDSSQRD